MKCKNCGFENKDNAKFCTKCGNSLTVQNDAASKNSGNPKSNSKVVITVLIAIIIILVGAIGYFAISSGGNPFVSKDNSNDDSNDDSSVKSSDDKTSSKSNEPKSWKSIGKYSGSGSGSQTVKVPSGNIKVVLSAHPIKNYATNHLYVSGSNGKSGAVDWGSTSPVETRSDSFTYKSSSAQSFTIDYYETVSWEVEFFRYQ